MRKAVFHRLALVALLGLGWIIHPVGSAVHEARHLVNGEGHDERGYALASPVQHAAPSHASSALRQQTHDHASHDHAHEPSHAVAASHGHDHHDHDAADGHHDVAGDEGHLPGAPCFMPPGCSISTGWTGAPPLLAAPVIDRAFILLPTRAADESIVLPPAYRASALSRAPPADRV